jgi:2-polyprenyl-6-methoxyphenol hydroxylase-like FAD-dependent oxidoreductase
VEVPDVVGARVTGARDATASRPEWQVLVVGSGVAALALVGFLRQRGLDPVVVPGRRDEVSGAVTLPPDSLHSIAEFGLLDRLEGRGVRVQRWVRRGADGEPRRATVASDHAPLVVGRDPLRDVLRRVVPDACVRSGTTVARLDVRESAVEVTFDDGVRERFDLVVGADGVGSSVRAALSDSDPSSTGTTTWTFPVDADVPEAVTDLWCGRTAFTVLPGTGAGFGRLTRVTGSGAVDGAADWLRRRTEVEWLLPEVLSTLADSDVQVKSVTRHTTPAWARTRVAFVGDAAWSHHPATGVGAATALTDAAALTDALTCGASDVESTLARYERSRSARPRDHRGSEIDWDVSPPLADPLRRRARWLERAFGSV